MKTTGSCGAFVSIRGLMLAFIVWVALAASWATAATEYFVKPDGDDGADGLTWATALASPQVALDKAVSGDTITVTNGVYELDRGGAGATTAILGLDIDKGITLRSVNGPEVTTIEGNVDSLTRIRLARISHVDAVVEGFTFQGGVVRHESDSPGVTISAGVIRDCVIRRCATYVGDAVVALSMSGTALADRVTVRENAGGRHNRIVLVNGANAILRNSLVTDNHVGRANSFYGGPSSLISARALELSNGMIIHCTIAGNYAEPGFFATGLRMTGGTVENSIIYHNRDRSLPMSDIYHDVNVVKTGGTIEHSIMTPLLEGAGNLDIEPRFVGLARGSWASTGSGHSPNIPIGDYRLGPGSPAIDAGSDLGVVVDRDGNVRPAGDAPDVGSYEAPAADTGPLRVSFDAGNLVAVAPGTADFKAHVAGADTNGLTFDWDFGNGMTADAGDEHAGFAYNAPGVYTVRVEVANASSETAVWSNLIYRAPGTVYAAANGTAEFPFATPETGTPSIQHAIAAAVATGSETSIVAVAAGAYSVGSWQTIQLRKPILIQGEGPEKTVIDGMANSRVLEMWDPNAVVAGVTISNGYHQTTISSKAGGVLMAGGTLRDCWVVDNLGGVTGGGGITMSGGLIDRCRITDNTGTRHGVGVHLTGGTLRNSLVTRNYSSQEYEGSTVWVASGARVENCTVVDNLNNVPDVAPRYLNVGGILVRTGGEVVNTIAWYNQNDAAPSDIIVDGGTVSYSAAPELTHDPDGTGNLSAIDDPGFIDHAAGNYRLLEASPCVNAGTTAGLAWITMAGALDLDGNPRLVGGRPEMGAYEFIPPRGTLILFR